ncbi:hypothetical protein AB0G79_21890 [Streptomyces sp. NPDC020807]|uniref:hypothetical protein n=1 Tax=Streptomyces sp. NPDC020807 TaxID=3155119 RepID=UPI0033F6F093
MSKHDPQAPGTRSARRRHASTRRGRGPVWLLAAGGVAVFGVAAAVFSAGSGTKGGSGSTDGGGTDGPPALIQADPSDPAGSSGTPGPGEPTRSSGTGGGETPSASASPRGSTSPSAPAGTPTATVAPSGAPTAAPTGGPTAEPTATEAGPSHPGKGRGATKRPR